jgi:protein phosphatase
MNFLRRLFGGQSAKDITEAKTEPALHRAGPPEPIITAPGASLKSAPAAPVIQQPTETVKRSTGEMAESPTVDPTPIMFGSTRQLPPIESVLGRPGKHVTYGMGSDVGMVRANNQDSLFAMFSTAMSVEGRPDFGLFIVADGMGGHHDGERASAIAVRIVAQYVIDKFYRSLLTGPAGPDPDRPMIADVLSEAVQKANEVVSGEIPEGGTTVTAAALLGDLVYIAHVGDSRAYLVTKDGIESITRDHSLVQRLIELDQLTPEEAAVHPQKNVLYRAIGQSDNLEVDTITHRLSAGARLLLCSDGLWNQISNTDLQQIVLSAKSPQEACDHLITIANERGGPDNITVVIVQVPG